MVRWFGGSVVREFGSSGVRFVLCCVGVVLCCVVVVVLSLTG